MNLVLCNRFAQVLRSIRLTSICGTFGIIASQLVLLTLCDIRAAANPVTFPDVQFIVYVTENLGTAFYLNTRQDPGCQKTTTPFLFHCPLPYVPDANGVPKLDFPGGKIARKINPGDILFLDPHPEFLQDPRSDLIRLPPDTGRDHGAGYALFYSAPDDKDTDGSTDVKLPSSGTDMRVIEEDLGLSIVVPNLKHGTSPVDPNAELGSLNGKFGWAWIAMQKDAGCPQDVLDRIKQHCSSIGGISDSASEGPVFYIFVSDSDPTKTPEPSSWILLGSGVVAAAAGLRMRFRR